MGQLNQKMATFNDRFYAEMTALSYLQTDSYRNVNPEDAYWICLANYSEIYH
jgi:hypothetical protein